MHNPFRVAICLVFLLATALAQGPPPMPKPGPEHQRLKYFVGQWKHEGDMKPGPFGPGGKITTTDDAHMLGDFFVVIDSKGTSPMGSMTEMAVLGYDPKEKTYTYEAFNTMGQHERSTGSVSGDTWTWINDEEMGGKTMKGKFILKEVSPTSYTYRFDMSLDDGKTWTNAMEGKATKVK
jgi:hypothetical protein